MRADELAGGAWARVRRLGGVRAQLGVPGPQTGSHGLAHAHPSGVRDALRAGRVRGRGERGDHEQGHDPGDRGEDEGGEHEGGHQHGHVDAGTLPLVLSLVDQLYDTRQRLLSLSAAVSAQDQNVQAAIISALERNAGSSG